MIGSNLGVTFQLIFNLLYKGSVFDVKDFISQTNNWFLDYDKEIKIVFKWRRGGFYYALSV